MKKSLVILIFMIICILPQPLFSAIMYDPDLEWKSIKTEHFWIHYHQGLDNAAAKMSLIAEKVHKQLVPMIGWTPKLRTDIVLIDNMYTANGFATTFPYNKIQIYLTRSEPDSILGNFDDWLEFVFTHEYTHILNMDTVNGMPWGTRKIFGRCCCLFPNVFVPVWMLEGNAVYHESLDTTFGRNNSTYTDMIFRMEIYHNTFKTISEASTFPRRWPTGDVPYLYGGMFIDYLEKKYGKGTMSNIFIENSDNIVPYKDYFFGYIFPFPFVKNNTCDRLVIHEKFIDVWAEWEEFLKIKYNRQMEIINKEEITTFTEITKSGCNTTIPRFSRDGNSVFYVRSTSYNKPSLMRYSVPTAEIKELCRINDPNSITSADSGTLYLSDAEFYRSFSIYNEAYKFDSGYRKITTKLRGSYIDITPDGDHVVFIKNINNKYSIILADKFLNEYRSLIADSNIQFSFTKLSPDGNQIVFSLKDKNGNTDIAVLDIAKNEIKRLMEDPYNDIEPAWHPDGTRILFSSDRNGIYNLYEYSLTKNLIFRITNVIGGAFSPDVSPDGKTIAFASYGRDGFDIALIKYPEKTYSSEKSNPSVLAADYFYPEKNKPDKTRNLLSEDYSVWNSIAPPFWVPLITNNQPYNGKTQWIFGFASPLFLPTNDTLLRHSYLFDFLAYTFEERAQIDAYYMYSRFYPNFIFSYYNDTLFYGKDEFPWKGSNTESVKRDTEKSGIAGISFPFLYYQSIHILSFSYMYSESHTDYYNAPLDITGNFIDTEAMVRMHYEYNCASQYAYSISPEDGRSFYLVSEVYDKQFGSDLSYTKIFSEYAEYLPGIWKNNVTMLRLRGGASFNNPGYKAPFNLGRYEKGKTGAEKTNEDSYGLRGYPSGLVYGNIITTGTIEYKFPILQMDLGYDTIPLMFRDLWINVFSEAGNVWENQMSYEEFRTDAQKTSYEELRNSKVSIRDFKSSAGIELNMRITLGYELNLEGYIGYAKGFNKYGEDQVYFAVSTVFEGAAKEKYKWLDYL